MHSPRAAARLRSGLLCAVWLVALAAQAAAAAPLPWVRQAPAASVGVLRPAQVEARVERILAGMSLEQKVGQMTQPEIRSITPEQVRRHAIGSVLNGGGGWPGGRKNATLADWLALAEAYHEASMSTGLSHPVPLVWGTDAVHGHNNVRGATLFPHNLGLGAADNPALVEAIGAATARAVRASGIGWTFAPTLAVVRDDRWGRTYESYSEDPVRVARLGGAMVRGLQRGLGAADGRRGVLATAKHYIGDGGTEGGVDQGQTRATPAELVRLHGAGYTAALRAGVQTVMVSLHSWYDTASGTDHGRMHGHRGLLTDVLKSQLGFDGFVVTDWNGIGQVPGCTVTACAAAINAGVDMVMVPEDWEAFIRNTVAQVRAGAIPQARIDDAVRRILRVKLRAGLFERGPAQAEHAGRQSLLQDRADRALARRAVRESLVLLKNERRVLPLRRSARVLLAGKGAHSLALQSGGWSLSWQGDGLPNRDFPGGTTVLDALRAAGVQVDFHETAQGVDVAAYDAVLAVVGETPYAEFRGDIPASGSLRHSTRHPEDLALLQRVAGHGRPVITVLLAGRALHVNDLLNLSDAFVVAWLPGTEGAGITDVLLRTRDGRVARDFSGRLPVSWPRSACQTPLNAGDAGYDPLFPLGYGLRYDKPGRVPVLDNKALRGGCGAQDELWVFRQAPVPPYGLVVGSLDRSWPDEALPLDPGAVQDSPADRPAVRVRTVQIRAQHDAKQIEWQRPARLVAWSLQFAALSGYADAALVFDTVLQRPPTGPVQLSMECEHPCRGTLDATALFAALPPGRAQTVKIPLACFSALGLNPARVDVPFALAADAPFSAAFAHIRIVAGAANDADATPCHTFAPTAASR